MKHSIVFSFVVASLFLAIGLVRPVALGQEAAKKIPIGKNVFLEIDGTKKRVLVMSKVCLREGQLEQLLTRKQTKEHEAVLTADLDAKSIHTALLLAGAEAGSPVRFLPKLTPPTGTVIKITVEYEEKGKTIRRPAQEWIRDIKTKKQLEHDWVFAGSAIFRNPNEPDAPVEYLANSGDIICVANFDTALLDLPIDSSKDNGLLAFEAQTDRIPALETPVTIILEPVLAVKKAK